MITQFLRRPWRSLMVLTVLGGLVAVGVTARQSAVYQTSISFAANRLDQTPKATYQYDGYYAIQAADLFSQTVVSWFTTPSVLLEVYDRAGLQAELKSLQGLSKRFKTKKVAAQNIVVTFDETTAERAQKVATAVTTTMQERAAKLNQTADKNALFEIVGSTPVTVRANPAWALRIVFGLVAGFLIGLSALALVAYVQKLPREADAHRD